MNKKLIITVVAVLLLGAAGFYFFCNKQATTESQVLSTTTPQLQGTTTAQVNNNTPSVVPELRGITPQFVPLNDEWGNSTQVLNPELKKIKKAALDIINTKEPLNAENNVHFSLRAVGKRYVVMSYYPPAGMDSRDVLVDFVSKTSKDLAGGRSLELKSAIVYITDDKVAYYKIDSPAVVAFSNSQLPSGQTYNSNYGGMPVTSPEETHTDNSMTIAVFDTNQPIQDQGFKKLRDVTFTLP
jgi:hypothetical protein